MAQKRAVLRHLGRAEPGELASQIEQFAEIARLQARRVGRGAHQQRLDEAALACHVARVAVVGLRVARREAGELAPVRLVVSIVAEEIAVARQHRAALIGDDLQPVPRQFEVAHDLGPEQRADIGAVRIEEARRQRAADGGAAHPVVFLQHEHVEAGALQVAGVDEAVVAGSDDDGVPALHSFRPASTLPGSPSRRQIWHGPGAAVQPF